MPKALLAMAVFIAGCAGSAGTGPTSEASLVRVIDGDSLVLETAAGEMEVRLTGVNTPDRGECRHSAAAEALASLVEGAPLALAVEGSDQYGRALARLLAGGEDVAVELVRGGHGVAFTIPSDRPDLIAAEEAAYAEGLGLWSPAACGRGELPDLEFVPAAGTVDPPGDDGESLESEVVALANRGVSTVDLTGWVLRDASSLHRYTFAPGTLLHPGTVIAIDSADPGWAPGRSPVWSNRGDIALLLDQWGRVVARWRY